jgi:N-acetylneuraminate synthase
MVESLFGKMISKPFLIAEIGINHNGNLDIAKKLIDNSKSTGFDVVKFQKRDIQKVYTKDQLNSSRESPWGNTFKQQKEGIEFNQKDYEKINDYCKKISFDWFASAWDENSLKFLKQFKLKYNKIASAMIVDEGFLNEVSKEKKYTFISTGMSTESNIRRAIEIFTKNKCKFELMHCVSTYPMKTEDANLETIKYLRKKFKCKVGYSGHENGVAVSLAALFYNITSLERHITLDRTLYGSDQSASLEYSGMRSLTNSIDKVIKSIGKNKLGKITKEEKIIAKKLRSHLKY